VWRVFGEGSMSLLLDRAVVASFLTDISSIHYQIYLLSIRMSTTQT
jgi:hypothetical protein